MTGLSFSFPFFSLSINGNRVAQIHNICKNMQTIWTSQIVLMQVTMGHIQGITVEQPM